MDWVREHGCPGCDDWPEDPRGLSWSGDNDNANDFDEDDL
jgi:hypothetical protein